MDFVSLTGEGPLRDLVTGSAVIYPFQYNPVTKIIKYYSRIRVRINFGESPVQLNKPRSKEEMSLLSNSGINFNNAANWLNPKYKNAFKDRVVANSVLASGDWYKIEIKDNNAAGSEGIYKVSKSFLESGGISLAGVDPRTIKIYGNGGDLLGDRISIPRPNDLIENAIYIEGENDGVFDNNDYILFYGRSVNNWSYDSTNSTFNHSVNYYTRSNYY